LIKPGSYIQANGKLSLIIAVVPNQAYVLVLDSSPLRLRQLSEVEYMLVAESARSQDTPQLGEGFARAQA
jgi:hypothetical protein